MHTIMGSRYPSKWQLIEGRTLLFLVALFSFGPTKMHHFHVALYSTYWGTFASTGDKEGPQSSP